MSDKGLGHSKDSVFHTEVPPNAEKLGELRLQVELAEYNALRAEVLAYIRNEHNLALLTLAVVGALFSFALSASPQASFAPQLALLLVTPLSLQFAALKSAQLWKYRRLSGYISDELAPRLNEQLSAESEVFEAFKSEESVAATRLGYAESLTDAATSTALFIAPGVVAQLLLPRLIAIETAAAIFTTLYWVNWALLIVAMVLRAQRTTSSLTA